MDPPTNRPTDTLWYWDAGTHLKTVEMHPNSRCYENGDGRGSEEIDEKQNESANGARMSCRHNIVDALADRAKPVLIICMS